MTKIRHGMMALALAAGFLAMLPGYVHAQKRTRDLITREEIENSPQKDQDIYQVIRGLRPHFLAPARGVRTMGGSSSRTALYVDGIKETDINALKGIQASSVEEVRYLDPTQSENEYGSDASGGAVVVKRTKSPRPTPVVRDTTKPPQR